MALELRENHLEIPLPQRLSSHHPHFVEILKLHREAVVKRIPCYADPVSGLSVMTAKFLAERNFCCESGCRHCPYLVE